MARLDNLGKGASGAAVQCMNVHLGVRRRPGPIARPALQQRAAGRRRGSGRRRRRRSPAAGTRARAGVVVGFHLQVADARALLARPAQQERQHRRRARPWPRAVGAVKTSYRPDQLGLRARTGRRPPTAPSRHAAHRPRTAPGDSAAAAHGPGAAPAASRASRRRHGRTLHGPTAASSTPGGSATRRTSASAGHTITRVSSNARIAAIGERRVQTGGLRERRDAHNIGRPALAIHRRGRAPASAPAAGGPAATALTQRARLALPGEKRTSQPSSQRCCGGALAFRPASSMRDSSAWSSASSARHAAADPLHHLARELDEGLRALRCRVEHHAGLAVAGRFGQAHVARDHGVEHLVAEVRLELLADLLLQRDARVEHHPQQADDLQLAVQVGVHLLDGVDQVGQAFEREVFALHRHDHAVRAAQAVQREQAQAGRAVDQTKS